MNMTAAASWEDEIVIAVLTYQRPRDIRRVIPLLLDQALSVRQPTRVLVVDNDPEGAARGDVEAVRAGNPLVRYVNETTPGIAAARNRALQEARDASFLVFIDDDETPAEDWLRLLLRTQRETHAQAVVGAVVSEFEAPLTPWVRAGRFFDRRRPPTGTRVTVAATNNLLLDLAWIKRMGLRFDDEFGISGGSDTLFTRQLSERGGLMVWNNEAYVVDRVPAQRTGVGWVLRRAYRSGNGWSRVSLHMAGPGNHLCLRIRLGARGLLRLVAGSLRATAGLALRSPAHQARGARTAARGAGFLLGTFGQHYNEYKRVR